jgi:DNA-binding response OmpR family regulator
MSSAERRPRLDEILIEIGAISETQAREALLRQRAYGGRFGSQLLYNRYITEQQLVDALARQLECEPVVLSRIEISRSIVEMVPDKVALSRRVVPFAHDAASNILSIACENPNDAALLRELGFVVSGVEIRLHVAAEIAINTALARYYLGRDVTLEDNLLLTIPEAVTETRDADLSESQDQTGVEDPRTSVMLVTDEAYAGPLLQSIMERDDYRVCVTDNVEDALGALTEERFQFLLVRNSVATDVIELIDRARKLSPGTAVQTYDSVSSLLLGFNHFLALDDLHRKNLHLFTSLLASRERLSNNHSGRVGKYVDQLCTKLGLPDKDRITITNAAFMHDIARYYYRTDDAQDHRSLIQLSVKLLGSLNYPPVVVEMLRLMYSELKGQFQNRMPIEVLAANILTTVDLFCDNVSEQQPLTLDRFDAVVKQLRSLVGKMFLPEVIEAFVELIQHEILGLQTNQLSTQIMIFSEDLLIGQPLEMRLRNEGFRTVSHVSTVAFTELYHRSEPDLMILVIPGEPEDIMLLIGELVSGGISFERTPTFLMIPNSTISRMTTVLERGIEDIVSLDDNLDLLITKIHKQQAKLQARGRSAADTPENAPPGAQGRLADMNLIDLLQALGPSRKTVLISVQRKAPEAGSLKLYLEQGDIIYAEADSLLGPDAVYEAITWTDGTWRVEPVTPEQLPTPNNHDSNESLLMEGCRLLDEKVRAGQLL